MTASKGPPTWWSWLTCRRPLRYLGRSTYPWCKEELIFLQVDRCGARMRVRQGGIGTLTSAGKVSRRLLDICTHCAVCSIDREYVDRIGGPVFCASGGRNTNAQTFANTHYTPLWRWLPVHSVGAYQLVLCIMSQNKSPLSLLRYSRWS